MSLNTYLVYLCFAARSALLQMSMYFGIPSGIFYGVLSYWEKVAFWQPPLHFYLTIKTNEPQCYTINVHNIYQFLSLERYRGYKRNSRFYFVCNMKNNRFLIHNFSVLRNRYVPLIGPVKIIIIIA